MANTLRLRRDSLSLAQLKASRVLASADSPHEEDEYQRGDEGGDGKHAQRVPPPQPDYQVSRQQGREREGQRGHRLVQAQHPPPLGGLGHRRYDGRAHGVLGAAPHTAQHAEDEELVEPATDADAYVHHGVHEVPCAYEDASREPPPEEPHEHLRETCGEGGRRPQQPELAVAEIELLHYVRVEYGEAAADHVVKGVQQNHHPHEQPVTLLHLFLFTQRYHTIGA